MEGSWMAKIQAVEELNCSTRVTDALLLSIHAVGADIANCECERQIAPDLMITFQIWQNLIGTVAVRPHLQNNFLSR
jgi:hypothetical protein